MHPYLWAELAAERHRDLVLTADRQRLAAAAAPPAALRRRLGRQLVSLGARIAGPSGPTRHRSDPLLGKEEGC
jgi:hypothetical protein